MPAPSDRQVFVAYPWDLYEDRVLYKRAYTTMERALQVKFVFAEQRVTTGTVLEKIITMIEDSTFGIYDVSSWNANVTLEYGVARGLGAKAFVAFNPNKTDAGDVPSDVRGYDRLQYRELDELTSAVESLIVDELGTGTGVVVDPLEADRQSIIQTVASNPGKTARQLADLAGQKMDYVQLLLRRSANDLTTTGATRGVRYYPTKVRQ